MALALADDDRYSIPHQRFKIVFLGEQTVGKSAIIIRFMYDSFDNTYSTTLGIDFLSKTIVIGGSEGKTARLQLWDTTGQERFRSLMPSYIRDSHVAIVVYDINYPKSFQMSEKWIDDVRTERGDNIIIFLVGNKIDLSKDRKVSTEEGEEKAKELKVAFIETCAKTGENIQKLFDLVGAALLSNQQNQSTETDSKTFTVKLQEQIFDQSTGIVAAENRGCAC